jgi:hypothetical protein
LWNRPDTGIKAEEAKKVASVGQKKGMETILDRTMLEMETVMDQLEKKEEKDKTDDVNIENDDDYDDDGSSIISSTNNKNSNNNNNNNFFSSELLYGGDKFNFTLSSFPSQVPSQVESLRSSLVGALEELGALEEPDSNDAMPIICAVIPPEPNIPNATVLRIVAVLDDFAFQR